MSAFSKLFGTRPDPLLQSAEELVGAARINGASWLRTATKELYDELPIIVEIDAEQWLWVFTIAGVFIACTRLNNLGIARSRRQRLLEVVANELDAWKRDGIAGFEDCKAFFERHYDALSALDEVDRDQRFLFSDSIGAWMAWNLLQRAPSTHVEFKLARMAGVAVTSFFFDWWKPH